MPMRLVVWVFACALLLAVLLTWTFLAMRSVVAVGGSCASGGALEIATPCPDGAWLIAPSIPGMIFVALSGSGAGQEIEAPNLLVPTWALLFGSLSWNFFEAALFDGGFSIGWLLCGLMFAAFAFPAVREGRALLRAGAWRSPGPGRASLWWWTACYVALASVGGTLGIYTYTLIAR